MSRVSSQILLDVYGCADDSQRWRQLLDGMCSEFNVRSAAVQIFKRDGFRMRQRWVARDTFSLMHAEQHDAFVNNDENPRTDLRIVSRLRNDVILRDQDVFAANCPHLAELKSRLSAVGLGRSVAVNLPLPGDSIFALVLHRASDDARPFAQDDEDFLRELVPHLQQMLKLAAARDDTLMRLSACEEAISGLHTGVIVCDHDRRVQWLNEAAGQIVQSSRYLSVGNGSLRCSSSVDEKNLRELIATSSQDKQLPSSRSVIALGGTESDAVQIAAFPARPSGSVHEVGPWLGAPERVVLLVSDLGRPPVFSVQEVSRLFSLSPAEASLAVGLCAGSSVSDYASVRGVSVGTARIQLKSILSKTNTRRQADLVRRICASVAAQTSKITH